MTDLSSFENVFKYECVSEIYKRFKYIASTFSYIVLTEKFTYFVSDFYVYRYINRFISLPANKISIYNNNLENYYIHIGFFYERKLHKDSYYIYKLDIK